MKTRLEIPGGGPTMLTNYDHSVVQLQEVQMPYGYNICEGLSGKWYISNDSLPSYEKRSGKPFDTLYDAIMTFYHRLAKNPEWANPRGGW